MRTASRHVDPNPPRLADSGQIDCPRRRGVTDALWRYVSSEEIAADYDDFFALNSLFQFDEQVVLDTLGQTGLVVDLGVGTGRLLLPLLRRGMRALAIDLSQHMLQLVREKALQENLPIECLRANLVELQAVRTGIADHCICMFSTLGMIRGRKNRLKMLRQVRRILKPGGSFILHAHNYWYNVFDDGGLRWAISNLWRAVTRRDAELGDKWLYYRGIADMYLHVFRRGELLDDLRLAGFRPARIIPLNRRRDEPLCWPVLAGSFRANGWIVICR